MHHLLMHPYLTTAALAAVAICLQIALWRILNLLWFVGAVFGIGGALFALWWPYRPKVCPPDVWPCQSHGADLADLANTVRLAPFFAWTLSAAAFAVALVLYLVWRALDKRLGPPRD